MMTRTDPQNDAAAQMEIERAAVRAMTAKQLAELGLSQLAYVRPVMMDGTLAYAVHGADGSPMVVAPDEDLAVAAIEQQDMLQVLIH